MREREYILKMLNERAIYHKNRIKSLERGFEQIGRGGSHGVIGMGIRYGINSKQVFEAEKQAETELLNDVEKSIRWVELK